MKPTAAALDQALRELSALGARLQSGSRALPALGPVDVGETPKSLVAQTERATLYRFQRRSPASVTTPVLIVYALVNRPYMTDLEPQRSMVRRLLDAGLDVYLVDWGYPQEADRHLSLDDYINRYLDGFVDHILSAHGIGGLNLLGICQGGTFGVCYAALFPEKVRNLITMVTPVDFHTPDNLLSKWVRDIDVDLMVDTLGNIPGSLLNWLFASLRPARNGGGKMLELIDSIDEPERLKTFLRMEKWIHDSPDQAGEAFRQFLTDFFQKNSLIKGDLSVGGRPVRLGRITMPVLNVYATLDHIVPPDASTSLGAHIASADYSELDFEGGHIGIYVSRKAQTVIAPRIGQWLAARTRD
ncbi:MAG TPA: class III poly(R)-hydroxyalkanoic acid synthase subunit PhaC [Gammaproteobacteria bacterium]|nr:class III poly(R)-hydroxyalkanoic acid synthase subunit PhaC [Gammaproteobacteria bacterium]